MRRARVAGNDDPHVLPIALRAGCMLSTHAACARVEALVKLDKI